MPDYTLNMEALEAFSAHLAQEERAEATQEKYLRDIRSFYHWLQVQRGGVALNPVR